MQIKIDKTSTTPTYETAHSSGCDLRAIESKYIACGCTELIRTGLYIEIPIGYEAQVRPRSGLSLKGIFVHLGTIDADYRGEIGVIITNLSGLDYAVEQGDRIAQLVFAKVEQAEFFVGTLSETERGEGGFGSTGK